MIKCSLTVESDSLTYFKSIYKWQLFNSLDNEPRLKGNAIFLNKESTIIKKGVFTTCKKTDNCPPWELSSDKITHDKTKKIIYYDDAWLRMYDVPVLYFPKFFHPDPTVKRQSGFITNI